MSEEFGNDYVVLLDDDGNETEYEMIDAVEVDDQQYVALLPVPEESEEVLDEDYQIVMLKMAPEEEGDYLLTIDDEEEFNKVWAIFEERLSEDYDIVS